jgi:hypothetical protein
MHSDSAVLTGTGHARIAEPAQDYALHRDMGGISWGVVADGCSSAGRTDIGARLWVLAFDHLWRQRVARHGGPGGLDLSGATADETGHATMLREIAPAMPPGVVGNDLQATIVAAFGTATDAFGFIAGDGALMAIKDDGETLLVEHGFTTNLPAYPIYLADQTLLQRFIDRSHAEGQVLEVRRTRIAADGRVISTTVETIAIGHDLRFACQRYDFAGEGKLRVLLAVTDGLGSRPRVAQLDTVAELRSFPNLTGAFLKRRLGKLGTQWSKDSTQPKDDLSVACVCWPDELPTAGD